MASAHPRDMVAHGDKPPAPRSPGGADATSYPPGAVGDLRDLARAIARHRIALDRAPGGQAA